MCKHPCYQVIYSLILCSNKIISKNFNHIDLDPYPFWEKGLVLKLCLVGMVGIIVSKSQVLGNQMFWNLLSVNSDTDFVPGSVVWAIEQDPVRVDSGDFLVELFEFVFKGLALFLSLAFFDPVVPSTG